MSPAAAARFRRVQRHACRACLTRTAQFRYRGTVRADRDHDVCFRCFRSLLNGMRARQQAAA